VFAIGATALLLALVIGGLTQVSRQSSAYDAGSNRTLAEQGRVLADQSNATASEVRALMGGLQGQTRQGLQSALDSAVQQTATQSSDARLASSATPPSSGSAEFAAVFADRAQAMQDLRAALDGLLGMQPLPTAGAPATTATPGSSTVLTATQATNDMAEAGVLLTRSDATYQSLRHSLATGAGRGRLPRSVWVTDPQQWQQGAVAAQVGQVATSPTLAAAHDVVLRTVRLTPPALPTPRGTSSGVAALSPVTHMGVTAVLANQGSVSEPRVVVRFSLADQSSGASPTHSEVASLGLDGSVTLPTAVFAVTPGTTYVLTVQVVLPPGQTLTNGTVYQQAIQVAPAT
jgi:hypothetical protein